MMRDTDAFFENYRHGRERTLLDLSNGKLVLVDVASLLNYLAAHPSIRTLDISDNVISPLEVKALAQNTTLRALDISNCALGNEGAVALANFNLLRTLDVSANKIGDASAKVLATHLSLDALNISYNPDIGLNALKQIALNPTLTSLDVCHNNLNDDAIESLSFNTQLTALDVSGNPVSETSVRVVAIMMVRNQCLSQEVNAARDGDASKPDTVFE